MFVYGDLKTVYVCLWWPEDCLCLFMVTWRLFMFVYGDLKTVYVCLWWPEDCLCWSCVVTVPFGLHALGAYFFLSWFYVLRGIRCAAFCWTLSAIDIPSQKVFRVLVLVQCSEPPSETKKHSGINSFFGMDAFYCLSPDQSTCPVFGAFVWSEKHSGVNSFFGMDAFHCLSPDRRLCWHCHYQHFIIWSRNNGATAQRLLCSKFCARITSSLTYTK